MNIGSPENPDVPEYEKHPASIRLEFFRHDEKGKAPASGDRSGDEFVRLTDQGRTHSTEVGKTKSPHPETAVAFGSERERSVETSMRQMLANEDSITPQTSLEDLRKLVDLNLKVGKKDMVLSGLGFDWDTNQGFRDTVYPHYTDSKDILSFLYHDSDNVVKELKDSTSSSYSRVASRFASMVKKYLYILPRWKEIIKENPEKYVSADNRMERYFGSHAATVENFLMKVIDKAEGPQAVEQFVKGAKKNGFGYSEGYSISIQDSQGQPQMSLTYGDKSWQVTAKMLDEIIKEGVELENEVQK